ncbi:HD domain-containing protein [Mycoplasma mycoides]|uniref:HD domain-containing protein n=1 Tax=Mycoplasma mycoides TaxID=2102 RepID=UPI002732ABDD|nr:HD domain-containing protein [Mycoplasma mycoides]MDP4040619.1 HD domain-containing protein [Mycoplasma mycoides]MDP4041442.1 HD domain-containing protein [Mycoplasma mycoides]MDP4042380.1 HD domain-containing protein [Mycoplasma mycoides]MDP4043782.1 HD domain-containing protein [Mycoplasma mycoides]MDP4044689.1 HD domain-containing protein [Mycoplasma mycoides]
MYLKVIRDNVHGDIYFDDVIYIQLINTYEIQRLRRILQLAGTQLAYPSATHTRFSHCIGTYYILKEFFKNKAFLKISSYEQKLVKIAGLLHDIGHGAFSHTFEKITHKNHEQYTSEIILNKKGNIYPILKKHHINPQDIVDIINGTYKNKIINLLVSSQIDADRFDYLKRDSISCGVDYATLDFKWMIRNAFIIGDKIVFPKKTIYAIESYLLGRYHMYQQVYNHKTSTIFDAMFISWFKRVTDLFNNNYKFKDNRIIELFINVFNNKDIDLDSYLKIDDYLMFDIFKNCSSEKDLILSDLSKRLTDRKLFTIRDEKLINKTTLINKLNKLGLDPTYYLLEANIRPLSMYNPVIKNNKDENIYLYDSNNQQVYELSYYSKLVKFFQKSNSQKNLRKIIFPKEIV